MSEIAKKHIEISIKTKRIAKVTCRDCRVYIATYRAGNAGQVFQRIEQKSGEEYWSVKAWKPPRPYQHLKDSDVIITQDERVKFLVEVKWGTVPGNTSTDLHMGVEEWKKMKQLLRAPEIMCRVRGPAVKEGRRYRSSEFPISKEYWTDKNSKLVLVTDFAAVKRELKPKFQEFMERWKSASPRFLIADINTRVGEIPSFREILRAER